MTKKTSLNNHIKTRLLFISVCFIGLLIFGFIISSNQSEEIIKHNGEVIIRQQRSCLGPSEFLPLAFLGVPIVTIGLLLDAIMLFIIKDATIQKILVNILYIGCFILIIMGIFSL